MSLKDYNFLTSTMGNIVDLDKQIKHLNDVQNQKVRRKYNLEDRIQSFRSKIEKLQKEESPNPPEISINQSLIEECENVISASENNIKDLEPQTSKVKKEINALESSIPRWLSKEQLHTKHTGYSGWGFSTIDITAACLFVMLFTVIFGFLASGFSWEEVVRVDKECSDDELVNGESTDLGIERNLCDEFYKSSIISIGAMIFSTLPFLFWLFKRRSECMKLQSEMEVLKSRQRPLNRKVGTNKTKITKNKNKIKDIKKQQKNDLLIHKDSVVEHDGLMANLVLVQETLILEIKKLEFSVKELAELELKIKGIEKEIIALFESVAHLTPHNSKL